MKSDSLIISLNTSATKKEIIQICTDCFKVVGGSIIKMADGFEINQGTNDIEHDNLIVMNARVLVRESAQGIFEVVCDIYWKTSPIFWNYFILGTILWIFIWLWLVITYNGINPRITYEPVLENIKRKVQIG